MNDKKIDANLSMTLGVFDENLEQKIFEHICLTHFKLPTEFLKRDSLDGNGYDNPMMMIAWLSWRYRAMTAVALYKEAHPSNNP